MKSSPTKIVEVSSPPTPPTTGALIYCFAGTLYVMFSTGKIAKIA